MKQTTKSIQQSFTYFRASSICCRR